jgi:hypothetical protein
MIRVQIEQEYGNRLYKLSQSILESPFDVLLSTTEITARTHIELSQNISEMLEIPWMHHLKQQQASRHAVNTLSIIFFFSSFFRSSIK